MPVAAGGERTKHGKWQLERILQEPLPLIQQLRLVRRGVDTDGVEQPHRGLICEAHVLVRVQELAQPLDLLGTWLRRASAQGGGVKLCHPRIHISWRCNR